nr:hypothetical protein [Myrmica scabrinodis virus 1]
MSFLPGKTFNFSDPSTHNAGNPSNPYNEVQWRDNPIYRSPEQSGISWYDQINHWDPNSESIFHISQANTTSAVPYWSHNDYNLASIRNEWGANSPASSVNASSISGMSNRSFEANPLSPKNVASTSAPSVSGLSSELEGPLNAAKSLASGAGTAANVVKGVEATASATPWGAIALVNSMLGDATAAGIDAGNRSTINKDFQANSMQPGSASQYQAGLIKDTQQIHANNELAGARIGGVFGPLGAYFGSLLANALQDNAPRDLYDSLKTGYSFDGKFNPQDTGSVNSGTTANLSGETNMQDNLIT